MDHIYSLPDAADLEAGGVVEELTALLCSGTTPQLNQEATGWQHPSSPSSLNNLDNNHHQHQPTGIPLSRLSVQWQSLDLGPIQEDDDHDQGSESPLIPTQESSYVANHPLMGLVSSCRPFLKVSLVAVALMAFAFLLQQFLLPLMSKISEGNLHVLSTQQLLVGVLILVLLLLIFVVTMALQVSPKQAAPTLILALLVVLILWESPAQACNSMVQPAHQTTSSLLILGLICTRRPLLIITALLMCSQPLLASGVPQEELYPNLSPTRMAERQVNLRSLDYSNIGVQMFYSMYREATSSSVVNQTYFPPSRKCFDGLCWIPQIPPFALYSRKYANMLADTSTPIAHTCDLISPGVINLDYSSPAICANAALRNVYSRQTTLCPLYNWPVSTEVAPAQGLVPDLPYVGGMGLANCALKPKPLIGLPCGSAHYQATMIGSGTSREWRLLYRINSTAPFNDASFVFSVYNQQTVANSRVFAWLLGNPWAHCERGPLAADAFMNVMLEKGILTPCITQHATTKGPVVPGDPLFLGCNSDGCQQIPIPQLYPVGLYATCSDKFMLHKLAQVSTCPIDLCIKDVNTCYTRGNYECSNHHYNGYSTVPCTQCVKVQPALQAKGAYITPQLLDGGIVESSMYPEVTCSAYIKGVSIIIVCDYPTYVAFCCSLECDRNTAPGTRITFQIQPTYYGHYCTLKYSATVQPVLLSHLPHTDNYLPAVLLLTLPYYVSVPFIMIVMMFVYFAMIKLRILWLVLLIVKLVIRLCTFWLPLPTKTKPVNGICNAMYFGNQCGAKFAPHEDDMYGIHWFIYHAGPTYLLSPYWAWKRFTTTKVRKPERYRGHYKTPFGPFGAPSTVGYVLMVISLGLIKFVEAASFIPNNATTLPLLCVLLFKPTKTTLILMLALFLSLDAYTIHYSGLATEVTVDNTIISVSKYVDKYTCVNNGYYSTQTVYYSSGYVKCNDNVQAACNKLWSNRAPDCNPNYMTSRSYAYGWVEGCGLFNVNSMCAQSYMRPAGTEMPRQTCIHVSTSFVIGVVCAGINEQHPVTSTGSVTTGCGKLTFNVGTIPPFDQFVFVYKENGFYLQPNHCPFFLASGCTNYDSQCTTYVGEGGAVRVTCTQPVCTQLDQHPITTCKPTYDISNKVLELRSCPRGSSEIIFEPIVLSTVVVPITDLTASKCVFSSTTECNCIYTVVCTVQATYYEGVYYPCNTTRWITVPCTETEACVKLAGFTTCLEPIGAPLNEEDDYDTSGGKGGNSHLTWWEILLIVVGSLLAAWVIFSVVYYFVYKRGSDTATIKIQQPIYENVKTK